MLTLARLFCGTFLLHLSSAVDCEIIPRSLIIIYLFLVFSHCTILNRTLYLAYLGVCVIYFGIIKIFISIIPTPTFLNICCISNFAISSRLSYNFISFYTYFFFINYQRQCKNIHLYFMFHMLYLFENFNRLENTFFD